MDDLDRLICSASRLPCSRFARECTDDVLIDFWFSRVRLLGDLDTRLTMVSRTPKLPAGGVHRICDPDLPNFCMNCLETPSSIDYTSSGCCRWIRMTSRVTH